jgi:hypothetical protein
VLSLRLKVFLLVAAAAAQEEEEESSFDRLEVPPTSEENSLEGVVERKLQPETTLSFDSQIK